MASTALPSYNHEVLTTAPASSNDKPTSSADIVRAMPLVCTGHSRPVTHLSYSKILIPDQNAKPIQDSLRPNYLIISACKDGNPILRNGATGDWIGTYLGHKGAIWCARLSGDGSWAATSSADFSANVWNAQTGEVIVSLPHKHIVRTCDLNPGADKTYCIKKQPGKFRNSHTKDLRLVTASQDSVVRIWNIPEKRVEAQWSVVGASPSDSQSPKRVRAVLWVRNNIIVTVTFDGLVTWWEIEDPDDLKTKQDNERLLAVKKIRDLDLKGITGQVEHDLETITIAYNQNADVLNAVTGAVIKRVTLSYKPSAFSINPEKTQFITGCSNDTWVRVHDYETGALLETFKGHHGPVHSISYSPDGNVAASGGEDGTIRIWKMKPGPFGLWST